MKRIIIDLDDTLCTTVGNDYSNASPIHAVVARLREYKSMGFEIVINTSRNMRTFSSSVGRINAITLPIIIEWLERHHIPFDEIHVGKPWCGTDGFYVDDNAIRPDEFANYSYQEILTLLGRKCSS
jgi:capsule biosynthesis phosphatase